MLLLLKNYALAPAFRLNPSVLPVATRRFLATSPNPSASQTQKTVDKPKRFYKKDLVPPIKRPNTAFVTFTIERVRKAKEASPTTFKFGNTLYESAAAWKNLSDAEKKAYAPRPGAFEEYKVAVHKWHNQLSPEAKKALKNFRARKNGYGYSLFTSEYYKEAKGNNLGEKVTNISRVWRSLSPEKQQEYSQRAFQTLYGIRARRAAQHEKELKREAEVKRKEAEQVKKIADKKKKEAEKELALKKKEVLKERALNKKVKAMAAAQAKKEHLKKVAAAAKAKKAQSGKKSTTKAKTKA